MSIRHRVLPEMQLLGVEVGVQVVVLHSGREDWSRSAFERAANGSGLAIDWF